jgi:hypothetical protein
MQMACILHRDSVQQVGDQSIGHVQRKQRIDQSVREMSLDLGILAWISNGMLTAGPMAEG